MMEIKDIVYNNLLNLIRNLSFEGPDFDTYFETLDEGKQNNLIKLVENISSFSLEIQKSRVADLIHSDFDKLITILNSYKSEFNDYPNHRITEILTLVTLTQKLSEAIEGEVFNIHQDVDVSIFSLEPLVKRIYKTDFCFIDEMNIENSAILIDFSNEENLSSFIMDSPFSIIITCNLMSKIGVADSSLALSQYVLINATLHERPNSIFALVCLHVIKSGFHIHTPYSYELKPVVSIDRSIIPGQPYQQFNDSLMIISEYNYQKDILDKYLRLYHLIENFMHKSPLVYLERRHAGSTFSIRDFKRMYDKINQSEPVALKKLIKKILNKPFDAHIDFKQFIFNKWNALTVAPLSLTEDHLNILIGLLRIYKKDDEYFTAADIILDNIVNFYSQLIYAYRNSLVHNRETEFHLTHETLLNHPTINSTAKDVLESFIIPTLEEISFYLIIEENDIVWYNGSKLTLWAE